LPLESLKVPLPLLQVETAPISKVAPVVSMGGVVTVPVPVAAEVWAMRPKEVERGERVQATERQAKVRRMRRIENNRHKECLIASVKLGLH